MVAHILTFFTSLLLVGSGTKCGEASFTGILCLCLPGIPWMVVHVLTVLTSLLLAIGLMIGSGAMCDAASGSIIMRLRLPGVP